VLPDKKGRIADKHQLRMEQLGIGIAQ